MSSLRFLTATVLALCLCAGPMAAQTGLTALARIVGDQGVTIEDRGDAVELVLTLSQPVPWRVFTLDDPRRVVLDFSEVAWGEGAPLNNSGLIAAARSGVVQPGWSRMVLDLVEPMAVATAGLVTGAEDGSARLTVRLEPSDAGSFADSAGEVETALFRATRPRLTARQPTRPERAERPVVVIDPGHGGIDPGAEAGGLDEATLMLVLARELKEELLRTGAFDVALTRDADVFVPLETRITLARSAGADLFLSLHADALAEGTGSASGATIYTLSENASDAASLALAERHDRDDLLAGIDLSQQGDEIALILMDIARTETAPRAEALADTILDGLKVAEVAVNSRPRRAAAFSVLKSPDFPSVLIEVGFLSSARDRARLIDPDWRAKAVTGIADGVRRWAIEDAERARLLRQ